MRRKDRNGPLLASVSLTETHSAKQKMERAEKRDETQECSVLKEATGCNGIIKAR